MASLYVSIYVCMYVCLCVCILDGRGRTGTRLAISLKPNNNMTIKKTRGILLSHNSRAIGILSLCLYGIVYSCMWWRGATHLYCRRVLFGFLILDVFKRLFEYFGPKLTNKDDDVHEKGSSSIYFRLKFKYLLVYYSGIRIFFKVYLNTGQWPYWLILFLAENN
jgi:hypothetical protein